MSLLKRSPVVLCALALVLLSLPAVAQEGQGQMSDEMQKMMQAWQNAMTPNEHHADLAKEVGDWKMTVTSWQAPGAPPEVSNGTAERSMELGGRVLVEHVNGEVMGQAFEGIGRTGYDNVTGEYWSTWTDSMSTGLSVMSGKEEGGKMVYSGEASDPMAGKKTPMKMELTRDGDNKETATFYMPMPDGSMFKSMLIVYERM